MQIFLLQMPSDKSQTTLLAKQTKIHLRKINFLGKIFAIDEFRKEIFCSKSVRTQIFVIMFFFNKIELPINVIQSVLLAKNIPKKKKIFPLRLFSHRRSIYEKRISANFLSKNFACHKFRFSIKNHLAAFLCTIFDCP